MRHVLAMALVLSLFSVAFAGCGGDDDDGNGGGLSKDDYITQADEICQEADQREAEAGVPPPGAEINDPAVQRAIVASLRDALAELEALEVPEGDEEEVGEITSALERALAAREDQFAAKRAKDGPAETEAEEAFVRASEDLGVSAGAYGLSYCQALGF